MTEEEMKHYLACFLFVLATTTLSAQRPDDAALVGRLRTVSNDSAGKIMDSLFTRVYALPPSEQERAASRVMDLASQTGDNFVIAYGYEGLGYFHSMVNQPLSLQHFHTAYEYARKDGPVSMARVLLATAKFYANNNMLPEAREYGERSRAIADTVDVPLLQFEGLYMLSLIHYRADDYRTCIELSKKVGPVFLKIDHPATTTQYEVISAINTIAMCFDKMQQNDSALVYFQRAEKRAAEMGIEIWRAIPRSQMASVLARMGRFKEAEENMLYGFEVARRLNHRREAMQVGIALASFYVKRGQAWKANRYLDSANALLPGGFDANSRMKYWDARHQVAVADGRYKDAVAALQRLIAVRDSADAEMKRVDLGRQTIRYELQEKEREIELLVANNKLRDEQIAFQNLQRNVLAGSLLLLLLILIYAIVAIRSKQKTNRLLQAHNETIEAQSEELTVSLENLKLTQEQLIQSEKMASLGLLTAGIAHELNNPMNFVRGGVDSLRNMLQDLPHQTPAQLAEIQADTGEVVRIIQRGVERMSKIITSLRTFSGVQHFDFADVKLRDTIEVALTMLASKIRESEIEVVQEYHAGMPAVQGHEGQLSQVFLNIIENAVQALQSVPKPRQITIAIGPENGKAAVAIRDNGPGIPTNILNRVMDPFFTTKEVGQGTGLGLSIARTIVQHHHGSLTASSVQGKGAEFKVVLPWRR